MTTPCSKRTANRQARLAILLAMTAGYVDAYGLITYSTFISLMGGNTTHVGSDSATANWTGAGHALLAIVSFVSGIILGTLLTDPSTRTTRRIAYLSSGLLILVSIVSTHFRPELNLLGIATLSLSMGIVNTTLHHVGGEPINLTFVTGMLNHIGTHIAKAIRGRPLVGSNGTWDTHLRRAAVMATVWSSFVAGAAISGFYTTPSLGSWILVPPLLILSFLATFGGREPDD